MSFIIFLLLFCRSLYANAVDDFDNNTDRCYSFYLDHCDYMKCSYSFRSGCSFNPDNTVKTWSKKDLKIGCDFVENIPVYDNNHTGMLLFKNNDYCSIASMIRKKEYFLLGPKLDINGIQIKDEYTYINLYPIKSTSVVNRDTSYLYSTKLLSYMPLLIEQCRDSSCSLIVLGKNSIYFKSDKEKRAFSYAMPMDFDKDKIKFYCDFISINRSTLKNETAKITLKKEGVCPIGITNDEGKTDTVYVRSVKTSDGYKALITKKKK